jgi:hypothetical protein
LKKKSFTKQNGFILLELVEEMNWDDLNVKLIKVGCLDFSKPITMNESNEMNHLKK